MPMIDGKPVRARWTSFKMSELSSVDNPAQPGALATIMKRHEPEGQPVPKPKTESPSATALAVAKYVDTDSGAHTFNEVLDASVFDEKVWPMTSALSQAIRSIMADKALDAAGKEAKVTQSVDEFLTSVRAISPAAAAVAEKHLLTIISKKETDMTPDMTLEQALARVKELEAELAAEKAKMAEATDAKMKAEKALIDATDETLVVDGQDVKKSAVGEASFKVFKSLDNRARTAELEKRAGDEFANVIGTVTEKALVLKAAESLDEPARAALEAVMKSAEAMAKGAFTRLGSTGGVVSQDVQKALGAFNAKVAEISKRDGIAEHQAMGRARSEFPAEFDAAYGQSAEAA